MAKWIMVYTYHIVKLLKIHSWKILTMYKVIQKTIITKENYNGSNFILKHCVYTHRHIYTQKCTQMLWIYADIYKKIFHIRVFVYIYIFHSYLDMFYLYNYKIKTLCHNIISCNQFSDIRVIYHYHYFICQWEKRTAMYLCHNINPVSEIFVEEHLFNDIFKTHITKLKFQIDFPFNHLEKPKLL